MYKINLLLLLFLLVGYNKVFSHQEIFRSKDNTFLVFEYFTDSSGVLFQLKEPSLFNYFALGFFKKINEKIYVKYFQENPFNMKKIYSVPIKQNNDFEKSTYIMLYDYRTKYYMNLSFFESEPISYSKRSEAVKILNNIPTGVFIPEVPTDDILQNNVVTQESIHLFGVHDYWNLSKGDYLSAEGISVTVDNYGKGGSTWVNIDLNPAKDELFLICSFSNTYQLDNWYYSIREKENTFVINSNKIMDQFGESFKKVKKLPKMHKKFLSPILMNKKGLLDFFCTADMPFYVGPGQEEFYNCDF